MTTVSILASLPQEWQDWVRQNLLRGCSPADMATVMVRDGGFDAQLAHAAIDEERRHVSGALSNAHAMPNIDTSANSIVLDGREIQILMSLSSPRVVLLGKVLDDAECDALAAYGVPRLERSPVVDDVFEKTQIHVHRTSRGVMLQRDESELVTRIEARLAKLASWPVERGEGLQLLHYERGAEYRPHFDWFDPALPGPRKHLERGGQRLATIIMYLTDVEEGGATSFPKIGLNVQPRKGSAVFFANTDSYGMVDQRALHGGEPVRKGRKIIATKWLRQSAYV